MTRLLIALTLATSPLFAVEAESKAPALIKNLGGCFSVSYRFVEDGAHDYELPHPKMMPVVNEWITVKDNEKGAHVVQHYGVYQGDAGKFETMLHFREEWSQAKDGSGWTQNVLSPSGSPRYSCTSPERKGQIRCQATSAPKPQRDIKRKDYDKLVRTTMLQTTPLGWVQSEMNDKVKKDGTLVATELGWIEYRKLSGDKAKVCDDAKKEFPQE